jgi:hypothetical protein
VPIFPELQRIMAVWPTLPEPIRLAILVLFGLELE